MKSLRRAHLCALMFIAGVGSVILGYAGQASAAGGTPCAACELKAREINLSPLPNISSILNHVPEFVKFPQAPAPTPTEDKLPGAFVQPWRFAKTDFDPSFRTSYWNDQSGPMNVATAPWQIGGLSGFGDEYFAYGMVYVGTPYQAPLALEYAPLATAAI